MKKAVTIPNDTHITNAFKMMLNSVGYELYMLSDSALLELHKQYAYTGGWSQGQGKATGYSVPQTAFVGLDALEDCDMFIDAKPWDADIIVEKYPRLKDKTVVLLGNGDQEKYEDAGNTYPVVTSNFWVKENAFKLWMPFVNIHGLKPREEIQDFNPPIGVLHNAWGWGYGSIIDRTVEKTGVDIHGAFNSPKPMIPNCDLGPILEKALCLVHLKSNDCPGYALYEAMACGVPPVVTPLLMDRMKFWDMFIPEETCLTWGAWQYIFWIDEETKFRQIKEIPWTKDCVERITDDIKHCCERLKDPKLNYKIGHAAYENWMKLTAWTEDKREQFAEFLTKYSFL